MSKSMVVPLVVALALAGAASAEPVASGPQTGQKVPGSFKPINITGPNAGSRECLYCKFGPRPVVMVFAREASPAAAALVKKLDAATAAHQDDCLCSCVIFLSDSKELPAALKSIVEKEGIKSTILAIDGPDGPASYKIAAEADVTVILYSHHVVKANHAFRKGELTDRAAETVIADLAKILTEE
jgi:hypothetical protein